MNLKTAALRLGVHYQTAYRWVRSGQLVAVKVGAGYEISDAAVARLRAQRRATERMPEGGAAQVRAFDVTASFADAVQVLDSMVDAVTLDSTAIGQRVARIVADHLGDTAFLYRLTADDEMVVVFAAHRDPVAEVAANTLGRDRNTSTKLVRRALDGGELICIAQVPQRELRRTLHPELHESLQLSGCYSALCAPFGVDGVLLVTRDLPGRPYTPDDVALVESLTARLTVADERARCWSAAWDIRRALVAALGTEALEGNCFAQVFEPLTEEPMVAVLDLELQHVTATKAYAALVGEDVTRLLGTSLRALVPDGSALDEALAPVMLGEIDFRSVEFDVLADRVRVALHVAMVRRADATPRGVVVVAHPVPALSGC